MDLSIGLSVTRPGFTQATPPELRFWVDAAGQNWVDASGNFWVTAVY